MLAVGRGSADPPVCGMGCSRALGRESADAPVRGMGCVSLLALGRGWAMVPRLPLCGIGKGGTPPYVFLGVGWGLERPAAVGGGLSPKKIEV